MHKQYNFWTDLAKYSNLLPHPLRDGHGRQGRAPHHGHHPRDHPLHKVQDFAEREKVGNVKSPPAYKIPAASQGLNCYCWIFVPSSYGFADAKLHIFTYITHHSNVKRAKTAKTVVKNVVWLNIFSYLCKNILFAYDKEVNSVADSSNHVIK